MKTTTTTTTATTTTSMYTLCEIEWWFQYQHSLILTHTHIHINNRRIHTNTPHQYIGDRQQVWQRPNETFHQMKYKKISKKKICAPTHQHIQSETYIHHVLLFCGPKLTSINDIGRETAWNGVVRVYVIVWPYRFRGRDKIYIYRTQSYVPIRLFGFLFNKARLYWWY